MSRLRGLGANPVLIRELYRVFSHVSTPTGRTYDLDRVTVNLFLVVDSTYANKETDCVVDSKKVTVGGNASIPKK